MRCCFAILQMSNVIRDNLRSCLGARKQRSNKDVLHLLRQNELGRASGIIVEMAGRSVIAQGRLPRYSVLKATASQTYPPASGFGRALIGVISPIRQWCIHKQFYNRDIYNLGNTKAEIN